MNQYWAQTFPEAYGESLEPEQSDHAPCLVTMPSMRRRVVKPFKFFDHIVDHPEYLDSVRCAWHCVSIQGTYQFKLQRSLKLLKGVLRRLNRSHFSGIRQRVKDQAAIVTNLQRRLLSNPDSATAGLEYEERRKGGNGKCFLKLRKSYIGRNLVYNCMTWWTETLLSTIKWWCNAQLITIFTS